MAGVSGWKLAGGLFAGPGTAWLLDLDGRHRRVHLVKSHWWICILFSFVYSTSIRSSKRKI